MVQTKFAFQLIIFNINKIVRFYLLPQKFAFYPLFNCYFKLRSIYMIESYFLGATTNKQSDKRWGRKTDDPPRKSKRANLWFIFMLSDNNLSLEKHLSCNQSRRSKNIYRQTKPSTLQSPAVSYMLPNNATFCTQIEKSKQIIFESGRTCPTPYFRNSYNS